MVGQGAQKGHGRQRRIVKIGGIREQDKFKVFSLITFMKNS